MTSCWTCLTWQKQCADTSTPCSTCTSLDLPCFGYDTAPPQWLDGGPKQRAQAEYFKNLVKQTLAGRASQCKQHKAKRRKLSSSESAESPPTSPGPQLDFPRDRLNPIQPECLPGNDIVSPSLLQGTGWISDVFQPKPLTFNLNAGQDLLLDAGQYDSDLQKFVQYPSFDMNDSTNDTSASILDSFADCPDITPSTTLTSASSGVSTRSDYQTRSSLLSATSTSHHGVGCAPCDSDSAFHNRILNRGVNGLGPYDTIALRWFLDSALPTNFPLMTDEVRCQVHKLITSMATRSKVCMAAIRSHMIHHRLSQLDSFGLSKAGHNDAAVEAEHLALIGIQDLLSSKPDPLTQIPLPDAMYEVRVTIAVLLLSKVLRNSASWPPVYHLALKTCGVDYAGGDDEAASTFFSSLTATIDLLSSTISGCQPVLAVQYLSLLQKSKEQSQSSLSIASITGLDLQTWEAILQTSLLWHWKAEQIESRSLSYRELVQRAISIEDSLLAQQQAATVVLTKDTTASSLTRNTAILSNVFVSAALVYLRTVISGAHPDVADIKLAVDRTMEAIQLTSDPAILCRMCWPVCVAASMAAMSKRGFWNKLLNGSKASITATKEGDGFTRVMKLVEKCWYMRDKGAIIDWSDAAKNMDTTLLML